MLIKRFLQSFSSKFRSRLPAGTTPVQARLEPTLQEQGAPLDSTTVPASPPTPSGPTNMPSASRKAPQSPPQPASPTRLPTQPPVSLPSPHAALATLSLARRAAMTNRSSAALSGQTASISNAGPSAAAMHAEAEAQSKRAAAMSSATSKPAAKPAPKKKPAEAGTVQGTSTALTAEQEAAVAAAVALATAQAQAAMAQSQTQAQANSQTSFVDPPPALTGAQPTDQGASPLTGSNDEATAAASSLDAINPLLGGPHTHLTPDSHNLDAWSPTESAFGTRPPSLAEPDWQANPGQSGMGSLFLPHPSAPPDTFRGAVPSRGGAWHPVGSGSIADQFPHEHAQLHFLGSMQPHAFATQPPIGGAGFTIGSSTDTNSSLQATGGLFGTHSPPSHMGDSLFDAGLASESAPPQPPPPPSQPFSGHSGLFGTDSPSSSTDFGAFGGNFDAGGNGSDRLF